MKLVEVVCPSFMVTITFMLYIMELPPENKILVQAQEPLFELPVQLVGFPIIILAVRLTNFVKKLSYSLNPQTYQNRNRRSTYNSTTTDDYLQYSRTAIDALQAEKQILQELGEKACVLEEPCRFHASRRAKMGSQPDWNNILRDYKFQSRGMKEWYLLSVFLGDVIRDVQLCKQLAKRLDCNRGGPLYKEIIRD